jgi:hypothetical protein
MMLGRALALAALLGVAGCSALAPYPTVPPAPSPGATAAGTRVSICYDALASSREEVRARAQRECPAHTQARFAATDLRMNHCPILLPARATFVCTPRQPAAPRP